MNKDSKDAFAAGFVSGGLVVIFLTLLAAGCTSLAPEPGETDVEFIRRSVAVRGSSILLEPVTQAVLWDGEGTENERVVNSLVSSIADGVLEGWWLEAGESRTNPVLVWKQNDGIETAPFTHVSMRIRADRNDVSVIHEWRSWELGGKPSTRIDGITTEWQTVVLPLPEDIQALADHSVFSSAYGYGSGFERFHFWVDDLVLLSEVPAPTPTEPEPLPPNYDEFAPSEVWLSTYNDQGVQHEFLKLHTQDKIRVTQRRDGVLVVLVHEDEDFDFAIDFLGATFRVKHWDKRLTLSHWTPSWPWRGWIMQYAEGTK